MMVMMMMTMLMMVVMIVLTKADNRVRTPALCQADPCRLKREASSLPPLLSPRQLTEGLQPPLASASAMTVEDDHPNITDNDDDE